MTPKAHIYLGATIAIGGGLIASCLASGVAVHSSVYLVYCLLAWFSSALKIRLPGITCTISLNFLFILVSVAVCTLSQTVLLAAIACVIQCFFRTRSTPRLVQVAFNVAALTISTGASYRISHWAAGEGSGRILLLLPVAAILYFAINTLLVSGALSLVEGKPLMYSWRQCYLWAFPYYLVGAALAGLAVETGRTQGWAMSLLILPSMYLMYAFYRTRIQRIGIESVSRSRS